MSLLEQVHPEMNTDGDDTEVNDDIDEEDDVNDETDNGIVEDEKDEASSEVDDEALEEGGVFKDDFESALSNDFDFQGKFAHAELLSNAPNPCISIKGVGLLGLPLAERDAKVVIGASEQAPYGHGAQTFVNKEVRNTWEIGGERIWFKNPLWEPFMDKLAKTVSTHLGVKVGASPPRAELYKLLLYEAGSHFLPHKDHEKTKGMFATIIIVLPSKYKGGQVHVSHGQTADVFDFSVCSAFGTALLSWYTDVTHEVKPVTSGYRLALSYNLIHTAPNALPPALPDMSDAVLELRRVLRKWKENLFEVAPLKICYLLDHRYSHANIQSSAFKGADAHRLSYLQPLCEELGFKMYLASLECYMEGAPDDAGYSCRKRRRYNFDSDEESDRDEVDMCEVYNTSMTVENLRDLHGRPPAIGLHNFSICDEDLIPEDPFEDKEPDQKNFEDYIGNGSSTMEYWYHRTVLILWHESRELDVLVETGGITALIAKLKTPEKLAGDERDYFATRVLGTLSPVPSNHGKEAARVLANAAITWNDIDLWLSVAKASGAERDVDILGVDGHVQALTTFPFERLRGVFEDIIQTSPGFASRVNLIRRLSNAVKRDIAFTAWYNDQICVVLGSLKTLAKDDLAMLMEEAEKRDIICLRDRIIPQLQKLNLKQSIWLAIIKALRARAEVLDMPVSSTHPWHTGRHALGVIMGDCVQTAVEQTNILKLYASPKHKVRAKPASTICKDGIARTLQLLELCVSMRRVNVCQMLVEKLLVVPASKTELETRFVNFYTPFVPQLKAFLQKHALRADMPPFQNLFRTLIQLYLAHLVGAPPAEIDPGKWKPKRIGCGCEDCSVLDRFIMAPQAAITFRVAAPRRAHLLSRIDAGNAEGKRYATEVRQHGSPHQLVVTKDPNARPPAALSWLARRARADAFMRAVGDAGLPAHILAGDGDALRGDLAHQPVAPAGPSGQAVPGVGSSDISASAHGKRKLYPDDVIDLT